MHYACTQMHSTFIYIHEKNFRVNDVKIISIWLSMLLYFPVRMQLFWNVYKFISTEITNHIMMGGQTESGIPGRLTTFPALPTESSLLSTRSWLSKMLASLTLYSTRRRYVYKCLHLQRVQTKGFQKENNHSVKRSKGP